jgi:hypothetical protein
MLSSLATGCLANPRGKPLEPNKSLPKPKFISKASSFKFIVDLINNLIKKVP